MGKIIMTKAKKALTCLIKNQSGQGSLVMVLVLLVVGTLIIGPLLAYMGTGLKAGQMHEEKTQGYYAADAGIEDAIWELKNTGPFSLGDLYSLGEQVNEMDVTVEILVADLVTEDSIRYVIDSTATRDGELKGEIIAQILAQYPGGVATGGEGGDFSNPQENVVALSTIDTDTIIFTTDSGNQGFTGWNPEDETVDLETNDLFSLDLALGLSATYLDGSEYGLGVNIIFGGAHYYEYEGDSCLLMSLFSGSSAGTNNVACDWNDIIRLHVDNTDPDWSTADDPVIYDMGTYFGNEKLSSLGMLDGGNILFSFDSAATWGEMTFEPYQVIEFDPGDETFALYLDVSGILDFSSNLIVTALSPLPDGRLLLSFNKDVDGSEVEGVATEIQVGDIAIWTPEGWTYDPPYPGLPYRADHPGTITLHINMNGGEGAPVPIPAILNIESWQIEK